MRFVFLSIFLFLLTLTFVHADPSLQVFHTNTTDFLFVVHTSVLANLTVCLSTNDTFGFCASNHNFGLDSEYLISSLDENTSYYYTVRSFDNQSNLLFFGNGTLSSNDPLYILGDPGVNICVFVITILLCIMIVPVHDKYKIPIVIFLLFLLLVTVIPLLI